MLGGASLETSCGSQLMSCRACHWEQSSRGVGKLSTLQLSTPASECLFPRGSLFQRIRNESLRFALASRLRCGGLEAASETSRNRLPCRVSIAYISGELLGRFKCRGTISRKKRMTRDLSQTKKSGLQFGTSIRN